MHVASMIFRPPCNRAEPELHMRENRSLSGESSFPRKPRKDHAALSSESFPLLRSVLQMWEAKLSYIKLSDCACPTEKWKSKVILPDRL